MAVKKIRRIPLHIRKRIVSLERKKHHPLVHHVRKKYGISRKTFFYMKEYGPKSFVSHVIIKESLKIVLLTAIVSSIGGFALQGIETKIITLLPLLILLPALNDMIGDFGSIVGGKFTTMLYMGKIRGKWYRSPDLQRLFKIILTVAVFASVYLGVTSYAIAVLYNFPFALSSLVKVVEIAVISTLFLVLTIFTISVIFGLYIYRHNEDPNNFLIPLTTSIADFGSLIIFSLLIVLFF